MKPIITLTMREIIDLVEFTGLAVINCEGISEDELDTMFTIADCPPEGVLNDGEPSDPASVSHYGHIVFCTDYPEEGCVGLGPEIAAAQQQEVGHG